MVSADTQHAEGAIHLTILNLPREERYLQEDTVLLGIILGLKEPTKLINCLLPFPTAAFGEKADYVNVDRLQWTPQQHKRIALSHKQCKTQAARESTEKQFGIRYSVLNKLPYFHPPRMCIIDPMHDLLEPQNIW